MTATGRYEPVNFTPPSRRTPHCEGRDSGVSLTIRLRLVSISYDLRRSWRLSSAGAKEGVSRRESGPQGTAGAREESVVAVVARKNRMSGELRSLRSSARLSLEGSERRGGRPIATGVRSLNHDDHVGV